MQLQHLKPGHRFELGTGELVQVDEIRATDDGLLTLRLSSPATVTRDRRSWTTAGMLPTAVISGGLVV